MPSPTDNAREARRTDDKPRAGTLQTSRKARASGKTRTSRTTRTRRLTMSAMFACLALIFTYVEVLIPYSVGIPGVKLGLANLVILIALYEMDARYALTINLIRICLSGLLFSGLFAMLYSLAGGLISLAVMWALKRTGLFSMVGVSMAGGVAHNFGQVVVAAVIVENIRMFAYFPVLLFTGLAAGILMGIVAYIIDRSLPKQLFN
ncbi:Gx transporter family protein [Eubacterium sp. AB3007]|uniref:Gx transporter family protein n=1 Tax=Eubacterium sp. AB3007 TaxID=1392487 RepID=UPI001FA7A56F|nr:Gx transporter family protein [Eubacterium sp. AB3007]